VDTPSRGAYRRVPSFGCPILLSRLLRKRVGILIPPGRQLLADAEFRNDSFVALGIVFLQVVEQATPLADQHEQAAARAVVLLVRLEVLRQLANAFAKQRYLDFRAAGIARMRAVLVDEGFLVLSG
jgi:hypothetical protein